MGMKRQRRRRKRISKIKSRAKAAKTKKTTSSSGGGGGKKSSGGGKKTTTTKKTFKKISLKGLTGKEKAQAMAKNRIGTGTARNPNKTIAQVKKENRESMLAAAAKRNEAFQAERQAKAARKKNLDKKLQNFDAKSYLNRYADLRAAFGTDEAAARRHYIKYGFDENRDISKFKAPTTAPAGAFGISAEGKKQAEANKREAAQQKKTYEQNRLKAGAKFASDRDSLADAKNVAGNIGKVAQGVQSIGKFIGNNPLQSLKIGTAALKDMAQLNTRYNQGPVGRQYTEKGKTDLYRGPRESLLKQDIRDVGGMIKAGRDIYNAQGRDAKLNAFANADPNAIKAFGTKAYPAFQASNLAQVAGEMAGLPSNFKMQIDQSKQNLQDRIGTIKIGDRDSTYQAVSDLARDIGTDPNLGFVSRLAKQYEYNNPYATNMDKIRSAFDVSNPRIEGLNREQRGLIEGALGNRLISGKLTDIAREGMQGLPTGEMFNADTLTAFAQNIAGNFTDPDSVASTRGSEIKTLIDPKSGDGINITIPSIIQSNPLNRGGSSLNTGASTSINTVSGNNTGLTIGGVDSEDTGGTGTTGGFTGETVGGTESGIVGGGTGGTGGTNTGDTGGSGSTNTGSTNTGSTGTAITGDVSGYDDNTITNIPGTNYDINEALRGLRFDDPDYRARLRRRRRNLLGFRGTFRRPSSRMTIAA